MRRWSVTTRAIAVCHDHHGVVRDF